MTLEVVRTFLFADIEGSTRAWQADPERMRTHLADHDEVVRTQVAEAGGEVFKHTGDGICAVFESAEAALDAAVALHTALASNPLRVRVGIDSGPAEVRDGDYFGLTLNRTARIMSAAHGGQTLVSSSTFALVRAGRSDLVDLGDHRLRDLVVPERLHQLVAPGLPCEFPPPRAAPTAAPLPRPRSRLFGRDAEVADVAERVESGPLVTLTGIGGCGKTRLAIAVADRAARTVADGVVWADLTAVTAPDHLGAAVARAVGLPDDDSGQASASERLARHLAGRRVLLVVDNCEHLLDPVADLLDDLLTECRRLTVLATSREPLGIEGERVVRVRSLAEAAGVDLFRDRATASGAVLDGGPEEAALVESICRSLDGIPLAIELAAARAAQLGIAETAALLGDRFRLLTGSGRRARQRQQTLQATMDWSHDLLDADERVLLRRLSVFSGGFDLEAVLGVCDDGRRARVDLADGLTSLVEKSLVVADPSGHSTRYRLLETVRLYASDRLLEAGESDEIHERHLRWYRDRLPVAQASPDHFDALRATIEVEEDNARAALDWARAADHPKLVAGLAARMWPLWAARMEFEEGRSWLEYDGASHGPLDLETEIALLSGSMTVASGTATAEGARRSLWLSGLLRLIAPEDHPAQVHARIWQGQMLSYVDTSAARALLAEARSHPAGALAEWRRWIGHVEALCSVHDLDLDRAVDELRANISRHDRDVTFIGRFDHLVLAVCLWLRGRTEEAVPQTALAAAVVAQHDEWFQSLVLGYLRVLEAVGVGNRTVARLLLHELVELTRQRYATTSRATAFAVGAALAVVLEEDRQLALVLATGARRTGLDHRFEPMMAQTDLATAQLRDALDPAQASDAVDEGASITAEGLFALAVEVARSDGR